MSNIKTRLGKCRECRWYCESEQIRKIHEGRDDGICMHPTRNGKLRKGPYAVFGGAACCFDAEDPDGQMTFEEVKR